MVVLALLSTRLAIHNRRLGRVVSRADPPSTPLAHLALLGYPSPYPSFDSSSNSERSGAGVLSDKGELRGLPDLREQVAEPRGPAERVGRVLEVRV